MNSPPSGEAQDGRGFGEAQETLRHDTSRTPRAGSREFRRVEGRGDAARAGRFRSSDPWGSAALSTVRFAPSFPSARKFMSSPGAAQVGAAAPPDGLPVPRRYWAIAAIILAICMSVLDATIANVALPSIARDFHATKAASIWVINSYQLAILATLLPLAALGEIVGYRKVSLTGMVVFTLASLGCAFSTSLLTMSIARVIQGLGAAGIMSVNAALMRFTSPHHMLGRAIGINAFAVAVAAATGPTIASAILAVAHWRWLFAINLPIGIATL